MNDDLERLRHAFTEVHRRIVDREPARWPEVLAEAFDPLAPPASFEALVELVEDAGELPEPTYRGGFSAGAFTLLRSPVLCLDLYFWDRDHGIDVHNHNFHGYFRPLVGGIAHRVYRVGSGAALARNVYQLAEVEVREERLVVGGPGVPIGPGEALVHDTEHLATPTVTLCVRTPSVAQDNFVYLPDDGLKLRVDRTLTQRFAGMSEEAIFAGGIAHEQVLEFLLYYVKYRPLSPRGKRLALDYLARREVGTVRGRLLAQRVERARGAAGGDR